MPRRWPSCAARFATERPKIATRQASQQVIDAIAPALPNLLGGSADLTHSNLTLAKTQKPVRPDAFDGSYIHYGVREHGMAAAMNGIALHGGFIPYGGTFLGFADYSRPAIRLAALMGIRVIHVMTHDSIGLGEDGPTHQPVEHLAALRAIPESSGVSSGRCHRDGGSLGLRAARRDLAVDPLPVAAGAARVSRARRARSTRLRSGPMWSSSRTARAT